MIRDPVTYKHPMDWMQMFSVGMDRTIQPFMWTANDSMVDTVNLGAGTKLIGGSSRLDAPDWWAGNEMPFEDESIDKFYAFHFFEHLTKDELIAVLRECERCLVPGGIIDVVVPHWSAEIAYQDIDHKMFFTEQTWKTLFENQYYDGTVPRNWKLYEYQSIIMGLVQRNLVLVSQLRKEIGV